MSPVVVWAIAFTLVISASVVLLKRAGQFKDFKNHGRWTL